MRVLHLIPTLGLGGAEAMLSRLVREWSTRDDGPRSIIACLDSAGAYHPEIEQLGVTGYEGGFQNAIIIGPNGTAYTLSLRPLLPEEES